MILALALAAALAQDVDATAIPRPEHPEPLAYREEWLNLNGPWEFLETNDHAEGPYLAMDRFPETILVPFCRESTLSGIGRREFVDCVWYRRRFAVPEGWSGKRVRLHFGASDWRTTVWLNGKRLGEHVGGSAPFLFEITDHLTGGEQEIVVRAFDDARSGLQQLGKQSIRDESYGIFYTRTTGIWQTVWVEAVGRSYVERVAIDTLPEQSRIHVKPSFQGDLDDMTLALRAEPYGGGPVVAETSGPAVSRHGTVVLPIRGARLWTPDDPFLYRLHVELRRGEEVVDRVESYFGLRTVRIEGRRLLLNGEPVFQRLVLDQGFYPDGIWTAPSDAALRGDIELAKAAGFNGARLHQKVFEPRFHYWADRLGYLTWGEGPSFGADYGNGDAHFPIVEEWWDLVERDRNHPSIVGWCPFNETPPEAGGLQNTLVELTKILDRSRPALDTSGWTKSHPEPDLDDRHDYDQNPETLARRYDWLESSWGLPGRYGIRDLRVPFFVSEFGGIGWIPEGEEGWGYGNDPTSLEEFYERYAGLTGALLANRSMFGFCYTQLTDVEQEKNGLYSYDRRPKFDLARIRAATQAPAAYESAPPAATAETPWHWHVLSPAAVDPDGPARWEYRLTAPPPPELADHGAVKGWQRGDAGFGRKGGWEERIHTEWTSSDLWLRRAFEFDGRGFDAALLVIHFDNETTVWLNGETIFHRSGWNDAYQAFEVTTAVRDSLVRGENRLAAHVHQDEGGQYFDAALLLGSRVNR